MLPLVDKEWVHMTYFGIGLSKRNNYSSKVENNSAYEGHSSVINRDTNFQEGLEISQY